MMVMYYDQDRLSVMAFPRNLLLCLHAPHLSSSDVDRGVRLCLLSKIIMVYNTADDGDVIQIVDIRVVRDRKRLKQTAKQTAPGGSSVAESCPEAHCV